MDGIAEAMTEEDEKKKYSNNATEGNPPHLRHLLLKRGEKALDDYPGGPEMMYLQGVLAANAAETRLYAWKVYRR